MGIYSNVLSGARALVWLGLMSQLVVSATGAAQRVESRNGSIYLIDASGFTHRLTNSTEDQSPSLSLSGSEVVYARSWPSDEGREGAASEIRIYNLATGADEPVLRSPIMIDGKKYFGFGSPRFSPDAKTVYFLINWAVTTHGLVSLDVPSHAVRFLMPAVSFPGVMTRGKYAGDLIVLQSRPKLGLGTYSLYYLFTPTGKEVGVVGDSEFDVGLFLDPDGTDN